MAAEGIHTLVQVAPEGTGGVSDFLQCLANRWAELGMPSRCIALSKATAAERSLCERIDSMAGSQACSLVVHFSGYGYGKRGLCFWLLNELSAVKARRKDGLRLVVVFHELYATREPAWRSAFWLSGAQALIAARLARLADAIWTNTEQHARWLRQTVSPQVSVQVWPVFSNVGEAVNLPALADRAEQAIVFGSRSTRQRAIDGVRKHATALHDLGVRTLVEVGGGGPSASPPSSFTTHYAGRLDNDALGRLLLGSRFGLLDYPPQFLGKSGVFAAYAAHGCAVLNTCSSGHDTDSLSAGREYLVLSSSTEAHGNVALHQGRASRLARWYVEHRLDRQARALLSLARPRLP